MGKPLMVIAISFALAGAALAQGDVPLEGQGDGQEVEQPSAPLTKAEQLKAGGTIVNRGTALSKRVGHAMSSARSEGDIIKVTCLNDKLAQINANLRTAQARLEALGAAVDPDQAKHEFVVLAVLGEKFTTLDKLAAQCTGQEIFETGTTDVTTEIDTSQLPFESDVSTPPIVVPPALPTIPPPASGPR